ncbi:hypothetical protein FVB32_05350 [Flagellimonas hymeniacidonis]|uniref:Uncharacterized protein n=1 Tax=Flagellimonas hymeniacidonis TaxID=2603628 RepID=A0A5C8V732_9FLAO|nr:hypothetical protein [Flagellimonas hymeniacidonis]TXN37715.1 hypothetical protein FVB32_05350 [Flagellimonas hymeniacidonis]
MTSKRNSTRTAATTAVKKDLQKKEQPKDVFTDLMTTLNELEQLRNYYNKLKIKRDTLEEAINKMNKIINKKKDKFEGPSEEAFPFEIVLKGENEHNRPDNIFVINQKATVLRFSQALLTEINQILTVFEADILEYSKKIK